MKEVKIIPIGKNQGYEHYHNEYYVDENLVGHSSYDNNQNLHIGSLSGIGQKNIYRKTPEGIARAFAELLDKELEEIK